MSNLSDYCVVTSTVFIALALIVLAGSALNFLRPDLDIEYLAVVVLTLTALSFVTLPIVHGFL
jgi:hypothetical protein